jgi:zinc/manganese transport system permease protein
MIEAVLLYKWAIVSSLVIAPALSLVGAQTLARNWTMRALIVGQATSLGTYFGLLLISLLGIVHDSGNATDDVIQYVIVLLISVSVAAFLGGLSVKMETRLIRQADPNRTGFAVSLYALLMAATAAIMSLSPHLESHLASAFTGDLSTASDLESRLTLALSLGVLGWIWLNWFSLSKVAFERTVLLQGTTNREFRFTLTALFAMALSMHSLGVLFVLGSLFIPPSVLMAVGKRNSRLLDFRTKLCVVSATGTFAGFLTSLAIHEIPTTPAIIFFQFATAIVVGLAWPSSLKTAG